MGVRLHGIIQSIKDSRDRLMAAVSGLSQAELDARPKPDVWSPGEVLHHLQIVELSVVRLLAKQVDRAEKIGLGADLKSDSLLASLDYLSIESAPVKLVSPEGSRPSPGIPRKALLDGLAASRAALLRETARADAFDLSQLHGPHPAFGRLDMYQFVLFLGQHELRHLHQIERALGRDGREETAR